jgi:hypothetical protein
VLLLYHCDVPRDGWQKLIFPLEAEQEVSLPHRLRDLLEVETPFGLFVALRGVGRASGSVDPVHCLAELHTIPEFDARDVAPCLGI